MVKYLKSRYKKEALNEEVRKEKTEKNESVKQKRNQNPAVLQTYFCIHALDCLMTVFKSCCLTEPNLFLMFFLPAEAVSWR